MFKPLADYVKASQREWLSKFEKESDPELERQAEFEAGIQEMELGRYEDAIPHLKKGTASKKYRKQAYYQLAECYRQIKMIPLARKTYERLMRLDYNYRDVQERIRALDAPPQTPSPLKTTNATSVSRNTATVAMTAEERYEILATLHEGQHSRIYQVRDTLLGRILALKQIDSHYPNRAEYLQQMKERTALAHPNILRIYDIDERQGQIAMEYVEGRDLRQTLRLKGALAPKMILYLVVQLINGLHQAHTRKIIHHALTPDHLLLTRQCLLKITAFRAPDSFMRLQKTDNPYKYLYIPPECLQGNPLDVASNIHSFGSIVYEMFVGRTPYRLQQIKAFLHSKQPLRYDETPLPAGVRPIIERCLAPLPQERYQNIRAAGEALIAWYKTYEGQEAHDEDISAYKDYLLMAWADGKLSKEEADFLQHKRRELRISDDEALQAEKNVKHELAALFSERPR